MITKLKIGIIGAGPAGSFSALLLSKAGHDVTIYEKREIISRKLCGEYLCPKGVELLDNYQLTEKFCHDFQPLNGMILTSPSEITVKCSFPHHRKEWNGLALNRGLFDQRILDEAIEVGTKLKLNTLVQSIEKKINGWKLETSNGIESVDLLIAADGRVSNIAKMLGHSDKLDTSRIAIHFYLPRQNFLGLRYGEMHIFEDGSYCGIDPINDDEVNVSFVFDSKIVKGADLLKLCQSYLKKSKRLTEMFYEIPSDTELKVVTPLTNKNHFIAGNDLAYVGDAAGFIDPLTGEGIYNALLSAHLLALACNQNVTIDQALKKYRRTKISVQFQKKILNTVFQQVIKKPVLCHLIAKFIQKKSERANYFIGIIGNVYSPIVGFVKMLAA